MQHSRLRSSFSLVLVLTTLLIPLHVSVCLAESTILTTQSKKKVSSNTPAAETVKPPVTQRTTTTTETGAETPAMSTGMMIGLGAGAAVLVGVAIAAGSGGGGSSSGFSTAPPTAAMLTGRWNANGEQPGSGLTYTGFYTFYAGGSLGYDLNVSDGEHMVGGGSWSNSGYELIVRTDHGSTYDGSFAPGLYSNITLGSNVGWGLVLTR